MRVAVIGASGIGKQHAKWFHIEGCKVVAFSGRTSHSVEATAEVLRTLFGFQGRGYTDYQEMLRTEKPDIAVVSTPPALHAAQALAALNAGAHLFLEKPMVWDKERSLDDALADARAILQAAQRNSRLVALNTQYIMAVPHYQRMRRALARAPIPASPRSFHFEMESKGSGGRREYEDIWIDMASHALSLLMRSVPNATMDEAGARCQIGRKENVVSFAYRGASGEPCAVKIICRNIAEGTPIRCFGVDDFIVHYAGRNDTSGTFRAYLKYGDAEREFEDFMQCNVRGFIRSVERGALDPALASGEEGYRNLELQVNLMRRAVRV